MLSNLPRGFCADPVEGVILTGEKKLARLGVRGKEIPSLWRSTGPPVLKRHDRSSFRRSAARSSFTASKQYLIITAVI